MATKSKILSPPFRYLRGYTLDPGFSTNLDTAQVNEAPYKIRWEPELKPGPVGDYIEVIDHDPASNCYYEPVDLNSEEILAQNGLAPSEGNPQFHQQFVYAVVMKTIQHFERALGRSIIWKHRNLPTNKNRQEEFKKEYVNRLRIYPHAFRDTNAYYDPEKQSLLFGYFTAGSRIQGSNFPGGVVFSCLSPDIVAHETTHAILDSIHERFTENTNADVAAFHEAFADIVALLQRFTFKDLIVHELTNSKGRLDRYNLLGELATQFGQALENGRGALRSFIGKWNEEKKEWEKIKPDPSDYQTIFEPHFRGAILVATIFDAFLRLYHFRTQDLFRIASSGTGVLPEGNLNPDLVKRLANEASDIAEHLLHICIRALDYCPPFDITFGNYLQALITADLDIAPEDENGYRIALIEAFRARGIFPDRVNTLSTESLQWGRPVFSADEKDAFKFIADFLKDEVKSLADQKDRFEIYLRTRKLQAEFHDYFLQDKALGPDKWEKLLRKLGLTSSTFTLQFGDTKRTFTAPKIEVHKIRPTFRNGREGKQIDQVIITITQTVNFKLDNDQEIKFRGGCTLLLSLSDLNTVEYIISKNILSNRRFNSQAEFQLGITADEKGLMLSGSAYDDDDNLNLSFKKLHFNHL